MKTPFDTALRVQKREVEAVRRLISTQISAKSAIDSESEAQHLRLGEEARISAALGMPQCAAWLIAARDRRDALARQAAQAEGELTRLRALASDAYGAMHATSNAAARFRDSAEQAAAATEQAALDDLAAAALGRSRRALARRRAA